MLQRNRVLFFSGVLVGNIALLGGCGSSSSSTTPDLSSSLSGLQSVPSVSGMITSNSAASSSRGVRNALRGLTLQAVSGTPETVVAYSNSSTLLDNHVFGGLISTITTNNTATSTQAENFWRGQGTCMLMQSVAESLGRMLEQGTSMCYMRNVANTPAAYTVVSGTLADPTTIFSQQADTRLVKVQIADQQYGNQDIFISVAGSNTVGSDVYQVTMYECQNGSVKGNETIEINKATGVFTGTGYHSGSWGSGTQTISAFLKANADGTVAFDPSKSRTANSHWTGTWGTYKGYVEITGANEMYGKRYNTSSYNNTTNLDKNYAITSFTGTSMATLRFLGGAYVGSSTWGGESHGYSDGTEFQDTVYARVTDSAAVTAVNAYSLAGDSFFTSNLTVTAPNLSAYSCSATPDISVTINMGSEAMIAISAICEADRFSNYDMCWDSSIQAVQNIIFSSQNYN